MNNLFDEIMAMHAPRPHDSYSEQEWIEQWLMTLDGAWMDEFGNVWVTVGDGSKTIFASHTDTVHTDERPLTLDVKDGFLTAKQGGKPSVLGADDTAGCWLMIQMIRHRVPGTYIFHRGEEQACLGSRALVEKYVFSKWHRIISFDRMGAEDVITFQRGTRCCSEEFASALANRLNWFGFDYAPSPYGAYTDSAEYMGDVPECTNISVGYYGQHSNKECLALGHLVRLADACIQLDWESLPTSRDPSKTERMDFGIARSFTSWRWDDDGYFDDYDWKKLKSGPALGINSRRDDLRWDLLGLTDWEEIVDAVRSDPEAAAAIICEDLGITV